MEKFQSLQTGFFVAVLKCSGDVFLYRFDSPVLPLEWLRAQVGGHIEIVPVAGVAGCRLVVNECGSILGFPVNINASAVYSSGIAPVVGDAVLCCDFNVLQDNFLPDIFAAPAYWINGRLARFGLLDRAKIAD